MPFDDLLKPVAVPAVERHDAATCCGERQEPAKPVEIDGDRPDAGEVERLKIRVQALLRELKIEGDQVTTQMDQIERLRSYAWKKLRHKVYGLSAQGNAILADALQKAASENATLRSEVERLRLTPSVQEEIVAWSVDLHDAREKIKRLTAEVERLRLLPDEVRAIAFFRDQAFENWQAPYRSGLRKLLERLGGGE